MREPKSRDEHITGPTLFISGRQMDKMPVSCTSTSDTGSEEMLPGKLTISTDDLDFADYGETKIRMTRD